MAGLFDASPYSQGFGVGNLRRKKGRHPLNINPAEDTYEMNHFSSRNHNVGNQSGSITDDEFIIRFEPYSEQTTSEKGFTEASPYSANPSSVDLKQSRIALDDSPHENFIKLRASHGIWLNFVWPAFAICIPMVLLSASLLYIVFNYRVETGVNMFDKNSTTSNFNDKRHLLVDFSATKLVFLASFLSTLAPLLAGCIMGLMGIIVYHDLQQSSQVSNFPQLPTPYQMSLLIGLIAASYEQLISAFGYLWSAKRRAKASPVLLYALGVFIMTVLQGVAVTITDAYLHVATQTVSITVYSEHALPELELGKGLSAYCVSVDRVKNNNGDPCTYASNPDFWVLPEVQDGTPESQRIAHDTSTKSTIQLMNSTDLSGTKIAVLMPEKSMIPENTNYMATTFGVASECTLMPPKMCNITRWGDYGLYLSFNCSTQFWGTLGMPVNAGDLENGKPVTPYLSFLAINPSANLIYNYFADESLETVYNAADLNASAIQQEDATPWPDQDLKNPVYLAFAWRASTGSFAGYTENGMVNSGSVQVYNDTGYVDYFVKCQVTSYDVTYSFVNGTLNSLDAEKHKNGSVLNMWTGRADYTPTITGSDFLLQDNNLQSVIAGITTSAYEARFGELLSRNALAPIGAFTSGRQVLGQQQQRTKLVAKVPKSALGALLACSLLYPILGIVLLAKARKVSRHGGPMTPLFSYWGLAFAAFLENRSQIRAGANDAEDAEYAKSGDQEEALKLFIRQDDKHGSSFGLYRRSQSGHVTEVQRSQVNVAAWI